MRAFQVYGKARGEKDWRVIDVLATCRRDADSRWPIWRNACTTWSATRIAIGWTFAGELVREQALRPSTRQQPSEVRGGRLGGRVFSPSELMAHECGHTGQARRLGIFYLPFVGSVTRFGEGVGWPHYFENQASEMGLFGGIVPGTLCPRLNRIGL